MLNGLSKDLRFRSISESSESHVEYWNDSFGLSHFGIFDIIFAMSPPLSLSQYTYIYIYIYIYVLYIQYVYIYMHI